MLDKAKTSMQSAKEMIEQLTNSPQNATERLDDIEKLCKTIRGALSANFTASDASTSLPPGFTPEILKQIMQMMKQGDKDGLQE